LDFGKIERKESQEEKVVGRGGRRQSLVSRLCVRGGHKTDRQVKGNIGAWLTGLFVIVV
jgi:hypothetical protein